MKTLLVVLSVTLAGTAHAADRLPKAMLGAWASDPSACGQQASELGMTIEPDTVLFYEHGFKIARISRQKDGSLKASGYSFDETGRTREVITLKLLEPGRIRVKDEVYHRCEKMNEMKQSATTAIHLSDLIG